MTKSFYKTLNGSELLIEFSLSIEQEDGEYTFDLDEIVSVFDEGASEELVDYDQQEIEQVIFDWLDTPKNHNKLLREIENCEY